MKPVHQDKFVVDNLEGDNPQRGNCLQAAIASVFELPLDEVPHFVAMDDWYGELERWLKQRNVAVWYQPAEEFTNNLARSPFGAYCLLVGKSPRGDYKHVVVGFNGDIVHDPHPDGTGLDGYASGAYYFVVADPAKQPPACKRCFGGEG